MLQLKYQALKTLCWGGPNIVTPKQWTENEIMFNQAERSCGFGLSTVLEDTQCFVPILEGYVLKQLLFEQTQANKNKKLVLITNLTVIYNLFSYRRASKGRPRKYALQEEIDTIVKTLDTGFK